MTGTVSTGSRQPPPAAVQARAGLVTIDRFARETARDRPRVKRRRASWSPSFRSSKTLPAQESPRPLTPEWHPPARPGPQSKASHVAVGAAAPSPRFQGALSHLSHSARSVRIAGIAIGWMAPTSAIRAMPASAVCDEHPPEGVEVGHQRHGRTLRIRQHPLRHLDAGRRGADAGGAAALQGLLSASTSRGGGVSSAKDVARFGNRSARPSCAPARGRCAGSRNAGRSRSPGTRSPGALRTPPDPGSPSLRRTRCLRCFDALTPPTARLYSGLR